MKNSILIFSVLLFSCRPSSSQSEKRPSPSAKYYVTTEVNSYDKDGNTDVVIQLYTISGQLKSSLHTHASDFSKWAVDWDAKSDTVIFYSSDIGTFAWKIESDSLKPVELTDNMKQIAKESYTKKYSRNP